MNGAGFTPPRKSYRLVFEDEDYVGAEVVCRSTSMAGLIELQALPAAEEMEFFSSQILESWNLTDESGQPVPATLEGVKSVPVEFYRALVRAWLDALTTVPRPLGGPLPSGELSPVPPIPMVTLS